MIPTPKDRFLADAALSKAHSDTVNSTPFSAALDAALLEYSARCAREPDSGVGSLLLRGAHEFSRVLCELSEPRTRNVTKDQDNL